VHLLLAHVLLPLSAQILALLISVAFAAIALTYFGAALSWVNSDPETSYLGPVLDVGVVSSPAVNQHSSMVCIMHAPGVFAESFLQPCLPRYL
jgi:hypothetical protein